MGLHRRLVILATLALMMAGLSSAAKASVIYVTTSGNDSNDGSSWQSAKRKVASALSIANYGDQVWVAAGAYYERLVLPDGVALYGGFPSGGGAFESRDWNANVTAIDGQQAGSVIKIAYDAGATTRIDGFTIRNGKADVGGGVYCYNANPVISNNRITANSATGYTACGAGIIIEHSSPLITANAFVSNSAAKAGGAIYCAADSSPVIRENTFSMNNAPSGGALFCADYSSPAVSDNTISGGGGAVYCAWGASATISGNTIMGNSQSDGAGVYCTYASPEISQNTISGNTSSTSGAGVYLDNSAANIYGNMIAGNTSPVSPAIYCAYNSSPAIVGNTIASNNSTDSTGSIYYYSCTGASSTFANNIIAFNSAGIYKDAYSSGVTGQYNCVFGNSANDYYGVSVGTGDVRSDPGFVNRSGGDYHLLADSVCINKGLGAVSGVLSTDIDGELRIWAGRIDIGADEFRPVNTTVDFAKRLPDSTWVGADGMTVTAAFVNYFYIGTDSRLEGIRVQLVGHTYTEGDEVSVSGQLRTNSDGERYIDAAEVITP